MQYKNKRGISPAISWVLLIGLSVVIASMVTVWMRTTAEEVAEDLAFDVEQDARCADVSISAQTQNNCNTVTIENRGLFSINKVKIRYDGTFEEYDLEIKPTQSAPLSLNIQGYNEINVIPVTQIDNQMIGCLDREVTVSCT